MNLSTAWNSHLMKRKIALAIVLSTSIVSLPPLGFGEHRA